MGVLEHTTAAWIIKEAITLGVDVRGIRVSASCDTVRFRQFLYEAFPMIEDISVYSKVSSVSCCTTSTTPPPTVSVSPNTNILPSSPQSLPSSPSSPMSASSFVPPAVCVAGVVAQNSRDCLSRQLLYKHRQSPSPLSRSPLSKPMNTCCRRERLTNSTSGSFFNGPLFRNRFSNSAEELPSIRCAAYAGNEFGEAHCGLVPEVSHNTSPQSSNIPIEMYDFYGEDDDSVMNGLTCPKRMRVVPCSPPLSSVIVSEDSIPPVTHSSTINNFANSSNHFDSLPFSSTSLFVSPPTSTSAPVYRPILGQLTNSY